MCGILGEFIYDNDLTERDQFLSLLARSKLRGPDSSGYFSNNINFQFGFNRLAILDLTENANQPIHSPSNRYTMVFNGEIYNHMELRASLPKHFNFKGNGDTESLIACFDHYGVEKTVNKLDGLGTLLNKDISFHLSRKHFYLCRYVLIFSLNLFLYQ